jgi:hypothetical protein
MKYALLGYDTEGLLDGLAADEKRALHRAHRAPHDDAQAAANSSVTVIAHYRVRAARQTTTVRLAGDEVVRSEGPSAEASEALRALYLLESEDPAARLPAVRMGGTVEVWPLIEPAHDAQGRRGDVIGAAAKAGVPHGSPARGTG